MEMVNCNEIVRGDVIEWPELVWDGYDKKTRKVKGERLIRGKVVSDELYDENSGSSVYRIKVIECVGDEPLAIGAIITRTLRVLTYQGKTARQLWLEESKRDQVLLAKRDQDNQPGF